MAWFRGLAVFVLMLCALASAGPCTNPTKRRAWHKLNNTEKRAYLDAELCLMEKPAKLGLPGARSRFDDFQAIHQVQAYATHHVGAFLPFHRLLMQVHETALRTECGYTGYQPYWHEQGDAGKFSKSDVFHPAFGFGGDGNKAKGNCIETGPFANYTNSLGPSYAIGDHCIDRIISDSISLQSSQANVDECLAKTDWETAWLCIEFAPHRGGHGGVGGEMINAVSSPGDPIFYLHHTWLDKVWWEWQALDPKKRTSAAGMGGTNIMSDEEIKTFPPRPSNIQKPTGADGDPGTVTTLGHVLNMYGNGPNKTIADVMDVQGSFLCYEYINP